MGKKSGGSAPPAPDPAQTAAAQSAANKDTAIAQALLNMVDTHTPYGSSTFTQIGGAPTAGSGSAPAISKPATSANMPNTPTDPFYLATGIDRSKPIHPAGMKPTAQAAQPVAQAQASTPTAGYGDIPRFRQDVKLSPVQQAQLEKEQALTSKFYDIGGNQLNQVASALSKPFNLSGIQEVRQGDIQMNVGADDFSADRQKMEDALYERQLRTLNPEWETQRRDLDTRLANQGIELGSGAYTDAQDIYGRSRNDAFDLARNSAIIGGGDEQSRLFGLDLSKGQFANQAQGQQFGQDMSTRQQGIQERVLERMQPIQEIAAMLGQGGNVQLPQFNPAPQTGIAGTDVSGIIQNNYANQLNAYNQAQANKASTMGGLFGLGGSLGAAAIMKSDIRVKENISYIGKSNGHSIYHFNYKNDPIKRTYSGVMAQEVALTNPDAVLMDMATGTLMVDYSKIGLEMREVLH